MGLPVVGKTSTVPVPAAERIAPIEVPAEDTIVPTAAAPVAIAAAPAHEPEGMSTIRLWALGSTLAHIRKKQATLKKNQETLAKIHAELNAINAMNKHFPLGNDDSPAVQSIRQHATHNLQLIGEITTSTESYVNKATYGIKQLEADLIKRLKILDDELAKAPAATREHFATLAALPAAVFQAQLDTLWTQLPSFLIQAITGEG